LVQDAHRVDRIHREFGVVLLHGWMNHHVPEDLHDVVVSLVQMVCVVKDGMGVVLYSPSVLSPSRSLIIFVMLLLNVGK
jgi:hypothetical protein